MKNKIAEIISTIGHPMVTFPIFIGIVLFNVESFSKALFLFSLIVLGIFIPLLVKMYRGTKSGKYTNFDISDQNQRKSFFPTMLILFGVVLAILFLTKQPTYLLTPMLWAFLLLLSCYIINFYEKVSLHTSLTVFLGFLALPINLYVGIAFLLFSLLMAWSRFTLGRHTKKEIILGILVGTSIGLLSLYF